MRGKDVLPQSKVTSMRNREKSVKGFRFCLDLMNSPDWKHPGQRRRFRLGNLRWGLEAEPRTAAVMVCSKDSSTEFASSLFQKLDVD